MSTKSASCQISTTVSGDGQSLTFPTSSPNNKGTAAPPTSMTLTTGHNPVAVPGAPFVVNGVHIISDPASTNVKTLKGANGDTGIAMAAGSASSITLTANFVIDSVGAETIQLVWY